MGRGAVAAEEGLGPTVSNDNGVTTGLFELQQSRGTGKHSQNTCLSDNSWYYKLIGGIPSLSCRRDASVTGEKVKSLKKIFLPELRRRLRVTFSIRKGDIRHSPERDLFS